MRDLLVPLLLLLVTSQSACDSMTPEEDPLTPEEIAERQAAFEASLPPLQASVEVVGPSPVRDSLRVRITSANAETPLGQEGASLAGARVFLRAGPGREYLEAVAGVSDMDGTFTFTAEVSDYVTRVVDGDTLTATRVATATLDVEIAQTFWQRGVSSDDVYEDDVSSVFPGPAGDLWVRLNAYRPSFWSAPDGVSFQRRREGFDRYLDSDGQVAWLEHRTSGGGGSAYLARVDLATGATVAEYQVFFNESIDSGAGLGDVFYGVHQGRRHTMHVQDGQFKIISSGPYRYSTSSGVLLGYHISPDGVHWLATTDRGVLRNDGSGWEPTAGLGSGVALFVDGAPDGRVVALGGDIGEPCVVSVWGGSGWERRAAFDRDRNGACGTVALSERGSVWHATSDGFIARHTDGVVDRRYAPTSSGNAIFVQGSTVWVATGDGLVEIDDH